MYGNKKSLLGSTLKLKLTNWAGNKSKSVYVNSKKIWIKLINLVLAFMSLFFCFYVLFVLKKEIIYLYDLYIMSVINS